MESKFHTIVRMWALMRCCGIELNKHRQLQYSCTRQAERSAVKQLLLAWIVRPGKPKWVCWQRLPPLRLSTCASRLASRNLSGSCTLVAASRHRSSQPLTPYQHRWVSCLPVPRIARFHASEALFLLGLERNADVVVASSFAPLLKNANGNASRPCCGSQHNLLNFNATHLFATPSFYVHRILGCSARLFSARVSMPNAAMRSRAMS